MNLVTTESVRYVLSCLMPNAYANSNIAFMKFEDAVTGVLSNRNTIEYYFKQGTAPRIINDVKTSLSSKTLVPSFSKKMEEGSVIVCDIANDGNCIVLTIGRIDQR